MLEVFNRAAEQRMASLVMANEIRFARARMKESLRRREVTAVDVVRDVPSYARSMKVTKLLHAIPGWGPHRVHRLMARARISDAKTVGGLSDRQRGELVALLEASL